MAYYNLAVSWYEDKQYEKYWKNYQKYVKYENEEMGDKNPMFTEKNENWIADLKNRKKIK